MNRCIQLALKRVFGVVVSPVGVAGLIAEIPQEAEAALDRFLVSQGLSVVDPQENAWVPLPPLRPTPPGVG